MEFEVSNDNRFADELRIIIRGEFCLYCGAVATTEDHFPPATVSMHGLILPACNECNNLAGTEYSYDLGMRYLCVKTKLKRKYKRILSSPDWTNKELSEVSYNLRCGVLEWQKREEKLQKRIAWNAVSYLASIDHSNCFAQFCAKIDTIIKSEKAKSKRIKNQSKINNWTSHF
jgi:hypothetical protein